MIVVPMDNPTVTVLTLVEAGSKYEDKKINGLSHFLEHMCFKGTVRRPNASDISRELDELGAAYNAFTSFEYTGYYAKGKKDHFKELLDIVSDLYLNPTFPAAEVEKEKGVICDEINMYEDQPKDDVEYLFTKLLYGDQPAGWSILGTKEIIRSLNRKNFLAYRKKHYIAKATTVIVAGGIKEADVFREVAKAFKGAEKGAKGGKKKVIEKQSLPKVLTKEKKTDQTHLILGVRAFDLFDKRNYALTVLAGVLGAGMSSRLFRRVRDEMGVGYYVGCGVDDLTDHGFLAAKAGVESSRALEVVKAILEEFKKLKIEKVSKRELDKVKETLINRMWMGLESSSVASNFFGAQEVFHKKIESPEEYEKKIRAVTAEEVQKIALTIFQNKGLNLAMISSNKNVDEFKKILSLQ